MSSLGSCRSAPLTLHCDTLGSGHDVSVVAVVAILRTTHHVDPKTPLYLFGVPSRCSAATPSSCVRSQWTAAGLKHNMRLGGTRKHHQPQTQMPLKAALGFRSKVNVHCLSKR